MVKRLVLLLFIAGSVPLLAQKKCSMESYVQQELKADPLLQNKLNEIDVFTQSRSFVNDQTQRTVNQLPELIKIPVVVHVLYHTPDENVSLAVIKNMISALNRDFVKKNTDTSKIPAHFKHLAVNMGFEFKLATMDPNGNGTGGVVRKYTPLKFWMSDDKMKFNSSYGDDGWDSKNYLNIWICNMIDVLGYSTFPGMDAKKDGIVIAVENFQNGRGTTPGINDGRTVVHEVGHWLNLMHIWGDGYCGDDKVNDTPKQSTYTPGCPTGNRVSCNNGPFGDMYMNYMDFTDDQCMSMFTKGQKARARAVFESGGPRNSILSSTGLDVSNTQAADLPEYYPQWLYAHVYPNPATSVVNVFFEYDERWIGKEIQVIDLTGKVVIRKVINGKIHSIDVSRLNSGVYFIRAEKDQEKIRAKFVKQ